MSKSLKEVSKLNQNTHKCLDCTNRTQRFNFDFAKIKGECLDCIKQSNFKQREVRSYESR